MNEVWAHIKTFLLNKGLDIAGAAVVLVVGLWAIKLLARLGFCSALRRSP